MTILYTLITILLIIYGINYAFSRNTAAEILAAVGRRNASFHKTCNVKVLAEYGIAMGLTDQASLAGADQTIRSLRGLGCTLPVYFCVPDTLSISGKRTDAKIGYVSGVSHESMKWHALMRAPFLHVLLIEPNVLFFTDPGMLFNSREYTLTGALFWSDPVVTTNTHVSKDLIALVPRSSLGHDNPILSRSSSTFASSDLLLIDKRKCAQAMETLWTLLEHDKYTISFSKELPWVACELSGVDYSFVPEPPGAIGEISTGGGICGHVLHFDLRGDPLCWTNGRGSTHFNVYSRWQPTEGGRDEDEGTEDDTTHVGSSWRNVFTHKCLISDNVIPLPEHVKRYIGSF